MAVGKTVQRSGQAAKGWSRAPIPPKLRRDSLPRFPGGPDGKSDMSYMQLIYASRPFGFDEAMLQGILMDARRCNVRDGISGALICRDDLFLQLLEGPTDKVLATYARIQRDDRHVEMRPLVRRAITSQGRMFGQWAMRDDPARSWVWSREDVHQGAIERATEAEVLAIFGRLAAEPA